MPNPNEVRDIVISAIVLALAFSHLDFTIFPLMLFIVALVFFPHEFAHRFVAKYYGCSAEYKAWPFGLLLGIITALLPGGIIFAAPGAVYISPVTQRKFVFRVVHLTKNEYGKISVSGPLTNILIGLICIAILFFYPIDVFYHAAKFSMLLAFFNLLPVLPLDGASVFSWNRIVWLVLFALAPLVYFLI